MVARFNQARANVVGPDAARSWEKVGVEVKPTGQMFIRERASGRVLFEATATAVVNSNRREWTVQTPEGAFKITRSSGG